MLARRINTDRRIFLKDARHPLMDRARSIPLQFEIGRQASILLDFWIVCRDKEQAPAFAQFFQNGNGNPHALRRVRAIFSKGKLSMDMDAVEPAINTERRIFLKDARHPLMEKR